MRIPLADPSHSPEVGRAAATVRDQRWGTIPSLYGLLLHSPDVAEGWLSLGTAIRLRTRFDARTRELLICLVACLTEASYEWATHSTLAEKAGVTEEELAHLPSWRDCASFSERERVLLALAEGVVRSDVDERSITAATASLEHRDVVEVVALAAYYTGTARLLNALGLSEENPDAAPER